MMLRGPCKKGRVFVRDACKKKRRVKGYVCGEIDSRMAMEFR